ncbi:MAG: hypothetical protein CL521_02835 [Actinobacteria bacterium]|nr:hypothetical protein [Actinomycetota bacterium]
MRLRKMCVEDQSPIRYWVSDSDTKADISGWVGQEIRIQFEGKITCTKCDRAIKKTYDGYCYPCWRDAPETAPCVIRPELCEAHLQKGKDPEWEVRNHDQPHYVYLALSSGVKVGVTRATQVPTRWIDQGAIKAKIIAETPNRYLAGCIEVALKAHVADKTQWRKMLTNQVTDANLDEVLQGLLPHLSDEYRPYMIMDQPIHSLEYPVVEFPLKVKSISLDKQSSLSGRLIGVKGQYLIFEEGLVLNIRKHAGYHIQLTPV